MVDDQVEVRIAPHLLICMLYLFLLSTVRASLLLVARRTWSTSMFMDVLKSIVLTGSVVLKNGHNSRCEQCVYHIQLR